MTDSVIYTSCKTGNLLVLKSGMFFYRGRMWPGLVDEKAKAVYDYPENSFNEFAGMKTALEQGLIIRWCS